MPRANNLLETTPDFLKVWSVHWAHLPRSHCHETMRVRNLSYRRIQHFEGGESLLAWVPGRAGLYGMLLEAYNSESRPAPGTAGLLGLVLKTLPTSQKASP